MLGGTLEAGLHGAVPTASLEARLPHHVQSAAPGCWHAPVEGRAPGWKPCALLRLGSAPVGLSAVTPGFHRLPACPAWLSPSRLPPRLCRRIQARGVSRILLRGQQYSAPPNLAAIEVDERWHSKTRLVMGVVEG